MAKKSTIDEVRAAVSSSEDPDIPAVCRAVREALGLTIPEYAKVVGLNARYLGDIERGHRENPTLKVVNRIIAPAGLQLGIVSVTGYASSKPADPQ